MSQSAPALLQACCDACLALLDATHALRIQRNCSKASKDIPQSFLPEGDEIFRMVGVPILLSDAVKSAESRLADAIRSTESQLAEAETAIEPVQHLLKNAWGVGAAQIGNKHLGASWSELSINLAKDEIRIAKLPALMPKAANESAIEHALRETRYQEHPANWDDIRENIEDEHDRAGMNDAIKGPHVSKNDERDEWMYSQRKTGKTLDEIMLELSRNDKGWYKIETVQGITMALRRYAQRKTLPWPIQPD
jgi:predicted transcriptional regulator